MKDQQSNKPGPPEGVIARLASIGENEKTEGVPLEDMAKAIGEHLAHRLSLKTIGSEIVSAITDRLIPQGANEIGNALFGNGIAYAPTGYALRPLEPTEYGVHGPEPTIEEKAAEIVALNEAKANALTQRQIDTAVSSMTPEEQKFADNFRQPPEPTDYDEPDLDF